MDLNQPPRDTSDFPSTLEIKIVCRKKANCRDLLVRKYGEERCNAILRNPQPLILAIVSRSVIIVFILHD
jgi:hypothetical protein